MVTKVALLTAGGFAPCLSSAVGGLIERYTEIAPEVEIIAYRYGYQGLLSGDYLTVTPEVREQRRAAALGSAAPRSATRGSSSPTPPIWSKRGLVAEGVDPLQAAADRLDRRRRRRAAHHRRRRHQHHRRRSRRLPGHGNDYALTVVGLPKTIDNDIIPIRQSLGAWTAAEQGARFAAEHHRRAQLRVPGC